jgi:hypothetical protein
MHVALMHCSWPGLGAWSSKPPLEAQPARRRDQLVGTTSCH